MSQPNWPLLKKWRDELRNDTRAQGRHALRAADSYCCLGILEEFVMKTPIVGERYGNFAFGESMNVAGLCKITAEQMGLPGSCNGKLPNIFGKPFHELNDNDGLTFNEIADLITIALIEKDININPIIEENL